MTQPLWIVDAFTSRPFSGNSAAVCPLQSFPDDATLQSAATQLNLPETAFFVQTGTKQFDLRWFSPEVEVTLCGHATLAATHVLLKTGRIHSGDTVTFQTKSGPLLARVIGGSTIELNFPALPGYPARPPAALNALGVEFSACERNRDNYLVEVNDYKTLQDCAPDFQKLAKMDAQGAIVTTNKGAPGGFDFASRYFSPAIGVNEDPVTGSAHCFLAPYWARKMGKTAFKAFQASRSQGVLQVTLKGDRVLLAGQAVITLKGKLPLMGNAV